MNSCVSVIMKSFGAIMSSVGPCCSPCRSSRHPGKHVTPPPITIKLDIGGLPSKLLLPFLTDTCVRVHTYCTPYPRWGCFSWFSRTNIRGRQTIICIFFCKQFENMFVMSLPPFITTVDTYIMFFLQAYCSDHPLTRDLMQVICKQTQNSNNRIQFFHYVCWKMS